jgi:hypothetical protein
VATCSASRWSYGDSSWGASDYRRSPRMFRIGDASTFTQTHGSSGPGRREFIHGMAIATRPVQEGGCCIELLGEAFGRSLTRVWVRRAAQ